MTDDFRADIESVRRIDAVPRILDVICKITGMGFAAVARVTEERWVCCAVRDSIQFGLVPGGELKVETTICHEIRQSHQAVIIDHVAEDAAFCGHHTPAMYGFQSYISMPIFLADGRMFGTLCAIDPRPAKLNTPEIINTFQLFAELIGTHLDAMDRYAETATQLMDERKSSELREQFIAVLGHDLRNPLAALASGTRLLRKAKSENDASRISAMMQSSINRMANLIDNVMDFARGRLGGGIALDRRACDVEPTLRQVISELQSTHPDRTIEVDFKIDRPVACDGARIAQLISNLLGNAIAHGDATRPILVRAATDAGAFELSVANSGKKISEETMRHLFKPFYRDKIRATTQGPGQGLGLGLYIADQIARAHGGTIEVSSTDEETRFTFRMPVA
jgi:signal transduction histidine kinase